MAASADALLITPLFPPQTGGIQRYLGQLCDAWPERLQVLAISCTPEAEASHDASRPYAIQRVGYRRGMTPLRLGWAAGPASRGAACVIWGTLRLAGCVGMLHPRLRRLPWAITVYGKELTTPSPPAIAWLECQALRRAKRVVAISRYAAEQAMARGARRESLTLISPAVPETFVSQPRDRRREQALRARYGLREGPILLSLGRLVLRKGVDQVLRALPSILDAHPTATYLIGGSGPDVEVLRALVEELGLRSHVRLVGRVPEEDLLSCYDLADLFLMPSRVTASGDSEGFGIVFLEAQARGLPVIAGDEGGMADAVCPLAGRLVDGRDVTALSEAILGVLAPPDSGRAMGQTGRRWVAQGMTTDSQRSQWERLAREMSDG